MVKEASEKAGEDLVVLTEEMEVRHIERLHCWIINGWFRNQRKFLPNWMVRICRLGLASRQTNRQTD